MNRRLFVLLGGGVLLFVSMSAVGIYLLRTDPALFSSSAASQIAVVTDSDSVNLISPYDLIFLNPQSDIVTVTGSHEPYSELRGSHYVRTVRLTAPGSQIRVTCHEQTSSVGVQFWGDERGGLVEVVVDNEYLWERETRNFREYVEFSGFDYASHTLHIRMVGDGEKSGGVYVAIAGISCQQRGDVVTRSQQLDLSTQRYDEIYLDPQSDAITVSGAHQPYSEQVASHYLRTMRLTAADSYLEATCAAPTSSVGVQFWGDSDGGVAEVLVDDTHNWEHATTNLREYVEFTGLDHASHTVRVRVAGVEQSGAAAYVTVAGIGCQPQGPSMARVRHVFLPMILN